MYLRDIEYERVRSASTMVSLYLEKSWSKNNNNNNNNKQQQNNDLEPVLINCVFTRRHIMHIHVTMSSNEYTPFILSGYVSHPSQGAVNGGAVSK